MIIKNNILEDNNEQNTNNLKKYGLATNFTNSS